MATASWIVFNSTRNRRRQSTHIHKFVVREKNEITITERQKRCRIYRRQPSYRNRRDTGEKNNKDFINQNKKNLYFFVTNEIVVYRSSEPTRRRIICKHVKLILQLEINRVFKIVNNNNDNNNLFERDIEKWVWQIADDNSWTTNFEKIKITSSTTNCLTRHRAMWYAMASFDSHTCEEVSSCQDLSTTNR